MSATEEVACGFFQSNTMDTVHVGSAKLRTGVFVGIPYFFDYTNPDQVERDRLKIGYKTIDWDSPDALQLTNSLILSDAAKDYAILREVYFGNTNSVIGISFVKALFGLTAYMSGTLLRKHQKWDYLFKKWARVCLYGFIGVAYSCVYIMVSDTINCFREGKSDGSACKHGARIMNGGLEYYDKQLLRNMALRGLMGKEGPPLYTRSGNYVQTYRRSHLDITTRRNYVQNAIEEHKKTIAAKENELKTDSSASSDS